MEKKIKGYLIQQRAGGIAALYLAAAYLAAIPYFLVVVDYKNVTDPAAKLSLLAGHLGGMHAVTLITYVIFGLALAVLALSLRDRFEDDASPTARLSAGIGIIWAGLLIASGTVFIIGMERAVGLFGKDAAGAISMWQAIEPVADGLGGAGGEILGGPWAFLVSLAGLRSKRLPRALCFIGMGIGIIGAASVIPPLRECAVAFGILQIPWLAWMGIVMIRTVNIR